MQNVDRIIKCFAVLHVVINAIDAPESSKEWCGDDDYHLHKIEGFSGKNIHDNPRLSAAKKGAWEITCSGWETLFILESKTFIIVFFS